MLFVFAGACVGRVEKGGFRFRWRAVGGHGELVLESWEEVEMLQCRSGYTNVGA